MDNLVIHMVIKILLFQEEIKVLQYTEGSLKEQLQLEKEKSYTLEQTVNDLLVKGNTENLPKSISNSSS